MISPVSEKSIQIIKNSAQLITQNDTLISTKMYEMLFVKYPELKGPFSNISPNQYMKLAEALSAYAVNIDNIKVLKPGLEIIAKVHVGYKVKAVHYQKVGSCLLMAIEEVLGERASLEFLDAWREAYQYFAKVLIEMETTLYKELQRK